MEELRLSYGVNNLLFFCCFLFQTYKTTATISTRTPVDNAVLTMILLFTLDLALTFAASPSSTESQRDGESKD
jgi:hypothetical protein